MKSLFFLKKQHWITRSGVREAQRDRRAAAAVDECTVFFSTLSHTHKTMSTKRPRVDEDEADASPSWGLLLLLTSSHGVAKIGPPVFLNASSFPESNIEDGDPPRPSSFTLLKRLIDKVLTSAFWEGHKHTHAHARTHTFGLTEKLPTRKHAPMQRRLAPRRCPCFASAMMRWRTPSKT